MAAMACGVHKVRRVRSRTLNRPVNCLGLMEAFARFSSDSDGSNAIEEPRWDFEFAVLYIQSGARQGNVADPLLRSPLPSTPAVEV